METTFHMVAAENWADLVDLFGAKGGPDYCWCMAWRRTASGDRPPSAAPDRKVALHDLVAAGHPIGLLARRGGAPVAWASLGPRPGFQVGWGPDAEDARLWCISCFYVPRALRGQGLIHHLIAAAEDIARQAGAHRLMASPVAPDSPSYRFGGFLSAFAAAGFREIATVGLRRHIVVKDL